MEVTNKEKKTREYFFFKKKATEKQDKNHSDVLKTCHDWQRKAK